MTIAQSLKPRKVVPAIAIGAVAVLGLSACNGSASEPTSSVADTNAVAPAASGHTITAVETEYHIALSSKKLKPGKYTFVAKNAGTINHTLVIAKGSKTLAQTAGDVSPGSSKSFTVTLKKGSYAVFCSIPGHRMDGMNEVVHVS